jgi:hypothetical protein
VRLCSRTPNPETLHQGRRPRPQPLRAEHGSGQAGGSVDVSEAGARRRRAARLLFDRVQVCVPCPAASWERVATAPRNPGEAVLAPKEKEEEEEEPLSARNCRTARLLLIYIYVYIYIYISSPSSAGATENRFQARISFEQLPREATSGSNS